MMFAMTESPSVQAGNHGLQDKDEGIKAIVAEDFERAIANYEAALAVFTRDEHPIDWARTRQHLGDIYASRLLGDRAGNLKRAIANYEAALAVFTRDEHPADWARTRQHLGDIYAGRLSDRRTESLTANRAGTEYDTDVAHSVAPEEVEASEILERAIPELASLEERVQKLMTQYAL